jgi:hypothetical protein
LEAVRAAASAAFDGVDHPFKLSFGLSGAVLALRTVLIAFKSCVQKQSRPYLGSEFFHPP